MTCRFFSSSFSLPIAAATLLLATCSAILPGSARATPSGFGTTFNPADWLVIRTNIAGGTTTTTQQSLAEGGLCADVFSVECVNYSESGFTIIGQYDPAYSFSSITLRITNVGNTWRPYQLSFNWDFTTGGGADATRFFVEYGAISQSGGGTNYFYETNSDAIDQDTSVFLAANYLTPAGSYIDFTVSTDNAGGAPPVLAISNFDAVELPAPLPLSGGAAAFAWSRRLRRRMSSGAAPGDAADMGLTQANRRFTPPSRSSRNQQRRIQAIARYGALIGRPPLPMPQQQPLPTSLASLPSAHPHPGSTPDQSQAA